MQIVTMEPEWELTQCEPHADGKETWTRRPKRGASTTKTSTSRCYAFRLEGAAAAYKRQAAWILNGEIDGLAVRLGVDGLVRFVDLLASARRDVAAAGSAATKPTAAEPAAALTAAVSAATKPSAAEPAAALVAAVSAATEQPAAETAALAAVSAASEPPAAETAALAAASAATKPSAAEPAAALAAAVSAASKPSAAEPVSAATTPLAAETAAALAAAVSAAAHVRAHSNHTRFTWRDAPHYMPTRKWRDAPRTRTRTWRDAPHPTLTPRRTHTP